MTSLFSPFFHGSSSPDRSGRSCELVSVPTDAGKPVDVAGSQERLAEDLAFQLFSPSQVAGSVPTCRASHPVADLFRTKHHVAEGVGVSARMAAISHGTRITWIAHMGIERKEPRVAETCRIVRLEEVVADYRSQAEEEVQEILDAIRDGRVTPAEADRIGVILTSWMAFGSAVSRELNIVADGAKMVRMLASTFAVTPKVQRELREKGKDFQRLDNVIPFPGTEPLTAA